MVGDANDKKLEILFAGTIVQLQHYAWFISADFLLDIKKVRTFPI